MYTLVLTNLDLGFQVKGWGWVGALRIEFQILKNKKLKLKFSKLKGTILVIILIASCFCEKPIKKLFERIVLQYKKI